jgi:AraC-like DNA-binding protein
MSAAWSATLMRAVLAHARDGSWARAADAGYTDQSHMTSEFHEIMRVTPAAFAAGRLPPVTGC